MARPTPSGKGSTPPGKRTNIRTLDILIIVIGFIAIIGYNRLSIARLQRSLPNVNNLIVGEWKAVHGAEHLVFREDKSVSMILPPVSEQGKAETPQPQAETRPQGTQESPESPASSDAASTILSSPAPIVGKYQLSQAGKIFIELSNGKKYSTILQPQNKNRFDLIDSYTEGVTTYERLP